MSGKAEKYLLTAITSMRFVKLDIPQEIESPEKLKEM